LLNNGSPQRLMSPSTMLAYNLSIVLQTIKKSGPISRADIARELQCSKSTITSSIAALEELELVHSVGNGNPKTGRKSILLAFNPTAHFFVAVDLRWKKVNLAIVDMSGQIHSDLSYQRTNTNPAHLIEKMNDGIRSLINDSEIPAAKIEALGIMVPGIVDTEEGIVRYSSTLGWDDEVDLVGPVRACFDKQITIFNDANALALGEIWTGCGNKYQHLAFIYTEGGVGGACIYNGRIILGANAAAGEFGKILVTGERGAQRSESLLSLPSLLARYGDNEPVNMEFEEVVRKAISLVRNGELLNSRLKMIDEIVDKMAQVIVGIIAVFNPQAVIINCSYLPDPDSFLEMLNERVSGYLPGKPHRSINLLQSCLNDKTEVIGAAAAAISRSRFHFVLQDMENRDNDQNYLVNPGK
jgi:predicted NBD/HSP70 family sugar kinase